MTKRQKTGGRQKGTPNRLTLQTRLLLLQSLAGELERIPEYLQSLDEEKRLDMIIRLLPYILPKMDPIPVTDADQLGLQPAKRKIEVMTRQNEMQLTMDSLLAG